VAIRVWVGFTFCVAACGAATTLATVGDSFADTFYFGLRARPDLLKQNDIELVRWSRPMIGLVRTDQFDYAGWLRETELGTADYCMVQVGTNDMQSIPDGAAKWVMFPGEAWKAVYRERVRALTEMLRERRCRRVIWVLQPGFEKSKFLGKNRGLINELQAAGVDGTGLVFEVAADSGDYGRDGIHFTGPFALKLADATLRMVSGWRERAPESCFACHGSLPASQLPIAEMAGLRLRGGSLGPAATVLAVAARSVAPPKPVVVKVARRSVRRTRRHS
jgi:hypothetical protein